MGPQKELIKVLYAYAQQQKKLTITFGNLVTLVHNYAQKFQKERVALAPLTTQTAEALTKELTTLEQDEQVRLRRGKSSQEIFSVTYIGYHRAVLGEWYKKMLENPSMSFPSKNFFDIDIPEKTCITISVSSEFQQILRSNDIKENTLINLRFDQDIADIFIVKKIALNHLEDICFLHLQQYLSNEKNMLQLNNKLKQEERVRSLVGETLKNLAQKPEEERGRFQMPSTTYYHLWLSIHNTLNKHLMHTSTQSPATENQLQAIKLLHAFIHHYYEQKRNMQIRDSALHKITEQIHLPPLVHSVVQLTIKAENEQYNNIVLTSEDIQNHLYDLSQPNRVSQIPTIIRFKTLDGTEYVIATSNVMPYINSAVISVREQLRENFRSKIYNDFTHNRNITVLGKQFDLEGKIEDFFKTEQPILYSLLNYRIIFLGSKACDDNQQLSIMSELVDTALEKLLPYSVIANLTKSELKKEASYILPVWSLIPLLNIIFSFFYNMLRSLTSGRSGKLNQQLPPTEEAVTTEVKTPKSSPVIAQRIQKLPDSDLPEETEKNSQTAMTSMEDVVGTAEEAQHNLKKMIQRWNPIIEETSRNNLIEDVNSLCKDSIKRIWQGKNTPVPDRNRVIELASRLAKNRRFASHITDTKSLEQYMELYMSLYILRSMHRV